MSCSKILTLLLFCSVTCFSQKGNFEYIPKNIDSLKTYVAAITVKKTADFKGNNNYKEIQKFFESQKTGFLTDLADSSYIFDQRIDSYLKNILGEIYKANAGTINPTNFYFFIDKSPIPNAACWGNGIFTVNLGLFDMVDTDDELAFILCHEMAHFSLKHIDKSLLTHVTTMNSKDTKKKISKAQNQRYGKRKAIYEVMKDLNYDFLNRSRTAETQADSLGFIFFSRTKYNKASAKHALKKLDLSDNMLFSTDPKLAAHFNFEAYPFKEAWLIPDETLFDIKEKADDYAWNKDSLKSHPDIPLRVARLEKLYQGQETASTSSELTKIKKRIYEHGIAISIDQSKLDMALYQVLARAEENDIDKKTYCKAIALMLKKTYELKASHNFGKYVSLVSPFSDEKYLNQVRTFLHNIELKNIRKMGLQFCQKYQSEMDGDADFAKATAFFTNLNPNN